MQLDLTNEEADALTTVLESYLSNLRYEIADTDSWDYRQRLKATEAVLEKIQNDLKNLQRSGGG